MEIKEMQTVLLQLGTLIAEHVGTEVRYVIEVPKQPEETSRYYELCSGPFRLFTYPKGEAVLVADDDNQLVESSSSQDTEVLELALEDLGSYACELLTSTAQTLAAAASEHEELKKIHASKIEELSLVETEIAEIESLLSRWVPV